MVGLSLNTGPWPVRIITLEDANGRRERLAQALNAIGVEFELFYGIDARSGVPEQYQELVDFRIAQTVLGRELTAPEAGCALSHLLLAKEIIDQGLPGLVIFEDDAILSEADYFSEFLDNRLYEEADLIQLGYGPARVWRFGLGRRQQTSRLATERLVFNAGLASAYSLSKRGARYLWEHATPLRCVADWPCDLRPIRPRILRPKLVGRPPEGFNSTLAESRSQANARRTTDKSACREKRNPKPKGYQFFHRFLSRTIF